MSEIFPPTPQQQAILDFVATGANLRVSAGAGTGKTKTAELIATAKQDLGLRGEYMAYNTAMKREAQARMPTNVAVVTTHGKAFRALDVGRSGWMRKLSPGTELQQELRENGELWKLGATNQHRVRLIRAQSVPYASASAIAWAAYNTVQAFQNSADPALDPAHIRLPNHSMSQVAAQRRSRDRRYADVNITAATAKTPAELSPLERALANEAREIRRIIGRAVFAAAQRLWACMSDINHPCRINHDTYLKLYQLALLDGTIAAPKSAFVILDEAQDTNPVVLSILGLYSMATQRIMLGDQYQSIYQFRGAINAMSAYANWQQLPLTKSWRYGPKIAALASAIIQANGADYTLQGNDALQTVVGTLQSSGSHTAVLFRTNAALIERAVTELQAGTRLRIEIDASELGKLLIDVADIARGKPITSSMAPEVRLFANWAELEDNAKADMDLARLVRIIEEHGAQEARKLGEQLANFESAADPQLTLSTAHKAKGLEWDNVELAEDFPSPDDPDPAIRARALDPQALNLLYVAVTRAQASLKINAAAAFFARDVL